VFGDVPLEAVDLMFFAQEGISAEDVIAVLVPEYDPSFGPDCLAKQKEIIRMAKTADGTEIAEGLLPDILRDGARPDCPSEDLPRRLVSFITGYRFLPRRHGNRDFKIIVEFNSEKETKKDDDILPVAHGGSLPAAHTCDNTIKFPALAYDGNREILEQKIDQTLTETEANEFSGK
jgi:hypothetical protein